ncbi:hypothetical protein E2C01_081061 [Portunus trituberculatus]|uniref:Uncharacterized protein n=1 Tax=Portunus trituberculatus TaxID=210409 RepID=A0A5B7IVL9_PORTR|nr:hypothetical protein [Portunus trituberculatus]
MRSFTHSPVRVLVIYNEESKAAVLVVRRPHLCCNLAPHRPSQGGHALQGGKLEQVKAGSTRVREGQIRLG